MRKEKDSDPDQYLWLIDPVPNPGGPKTSGSPKLLRSVFEGGGGGGFGGGGRSQAVVPRDSPGKMAGRFYQLFLVLSGSFYSLFCVQVDSW
jgi:hypothetical protein